MRRPLLKSAAFLMLILLAGALSAQDWLKPGKQAFVQSLPAAPVTVTRGGPPVAAEFRLRIRKGYHINSNKPYSELLIPTELKLALAAGVEAGKVQYPAGHDFTLAADPSEPLSVYTGDVTLKFTVRATKSARPGTHTLKAELRSQACDDNACYPPRTDSFELTVTVR